MEVVFFFNILAERARTNTNLRNKTRRPKKIKGHRQSTHCQSATHYIMATIQTPRQHLPQGFISSYSPRLRAYRNSLLAPVFPQANTVAPTRTTKRGTISINYAEDGYDEVDFDDSDGPRRFTGLRSLRRDDSGSQVQHMLQERSRKVANAPVHVQGVWRDWMGKPKRV